MSMTVTLTPSAAHRLALAVRVLTGAAAGQPGRTVTASATSASITPTGTGSLVYGGFGCAPQSLPDTETAFDANTTILGTAGGGGAFIPDYAALVSASVTTSGTPVTLGCLNNNGAGSVALVLCEILAASGSLAEDASTPPVVPASGGSSYVSASSLTTASFSPPAGALLVAVAVSSAGGLTAASVTDSSGLTWTQQVQVQSGASSQAAIYTAQVPGAGGPASAQGSASVTDPRSGTATVGEGVTGKVTATAAAGGAATVS